MSLVSTMIDGVTNCANAVSNKMINVKTSVKNFANTVKTSCDNFFADFKINALLHKCGAKSVYGYSPITIFKTFFNTHLKCTNFYFETKFSKYCEVSKDAGYEFVKQPNINWRQFQYEVASEAVDHLDAINDNKNRDSVFILDDTPLKKNSSKKIELTAKKFDHSTHTYYKGYSSLSLAYTDQISTICVAQAPLASPNEENIYVSARNDFNSRSLAAKRRAEAVQHMPDVAYNLVAGAMDAGITATAAVFDSWFCTAPFVIRLAKLLPCIWIVKKGNAYSYVFNKKSMTIHDVYRSLKNKRRGKAKIICSCIITLQDTDGNSIPAKIVFVRDRNTHDWIPILSTDITLSDERIVKLYSLRWNIEVMFRDFKQFLNFEHGCQSTNYDSLVAYLSILQTVHTYIVLQKRASIDTRSFGELFRCCIEEIKQRSFEDAFMIVISTFYERIDQACADNKKLSKEEIINVFIESYNLSIGDVMQQLFRTQGKPEPRKLAVAA